MEAGQHAVGEPGSDRSPLGFCAPGHLEGSTVDLRSALRHNLEVLFSTRLQAPYEFASIRCTGLVLHRLAASYSCSMTDRRAF